jgi:hypothetical protein
MPAKLPPNHVLVQFGDNIPSMARGPALLELEKYLRREWKLDAEVFMETMRDQNKLRRDLTREDVI